MVPYAISGWLDKNKDTLNMDLVTALATSKQELIRDIFTDPSMATSTSNNDNDGGRSRNRRSDDKEKRKSMQAAKARLKIIHNISYNELYLFLGERGNQVQGGPHYARTDARLLESALRSVHQTQRP